jgi:hypothetical protein
MIQYKNKMAFPMKKLIHFCLVTSIVAFSPVLRAQDQEHTPQYTPSENGNEPQRVPEEAQDYGSEQTPVDESPSDAEDSTHDSTPSDELTTPETAPLDNEDEGTAVGQASSEGVNAAKRKQWQNIALATAAVAVAITALVLIANNDGHRSKDAHRSKN